MLHGKSEQCPLYHMYSVVTLLSFWLHNISSVPMSISDNCFYLMRPVFLLFVLIYAIIFKLNSVHDTKEKKTGRNLTVLRPILPLSLGTLCVLIL